MAARRIRRSRRVGRGRRMRRAYASQRIGRAHSTAITCDFETENVNVAQVPGVSSTMTGFNSAGRILWGDQSLTGSQVGNAALLVFKYSLADLTSFAPGYRSIAALYDYAKFNHVKFTFVSNVNPKTQEVVNSDLSAGATGIVSPAIDWTNMPTSDPDVSYVDYDGWTVQSPIGGGTIPTAGITGDWTVLSMNRQGAQQHPAFKTFTRTVYPRYMQFTAADSNAANPLSAQVAFQVGGRHGWQTSPTLGLFGGYLFVAVAYCGPNGAVAQQQPKYYRTVTTIYNVSLKCALFG